MRINIPNFPNNLGLSPKLSSVFRRLRSKTINISTKIVSRSGKTSLKNNFNNINSREFLVASIVNYKFYVFKLINPSSPKVISHSVIDIPATCLGDSDVTKLDEYSEIILTQILGQDSTLKLPSYILIEPEYFASDTTLSIEENIDYKYLSLSPFIPANTLYSSSNYSYSDKSLKSLRKNSKTSDTLAKMHNQSEVNSKEFDCNNFVRLDFINREFIKKLISPFAQISLPIYTVTSLDFPIIDSIQKKYEGFSFYLACGNLSSILYIIHSDGFLKSIKIPVGLKMYHYPIDNTIEYDNFLSRLGSIVDNKISGLDLDQKSTNIIISGIEQDAHDIDFTLFTKLRLSVLSLNDHIKSLNLKNIEKLNLLSTGTQTSIINKILFASTCLTTLP